MDDLADFFQDGIDGLLVGETFVKGLHDPDDGFVRVTHLIEESPVLVLFVDIHKGVGAVVRYGSRRDREIQPELCLRAENGFVDFFSQNCGPVAEGEPV